MIVTEHDPVKLVSLENEPRVPKDWAKHFGKISFFKGVNKVVVHPRKEIFDLLNSPIVIPSHDLVDWYQRNALRLATGKLFNGTMGTMDNVSCRDGVLTIELGATTYISYINRILANRQENKPMNDGELNVIVISLSIKTKDGYFLFAERGNATQTGNGNIGCFGGCWNIVDADSIKQKETQRSETPTDKFIQLRFPINPDPIRLNNATIHLNPLTIAKEELHEELGLNHTIETNPIFSGLLFDSEQRPVFLYSCTIPLTLAEALQAFNSNNSDEHTRLHVVHADAKSIEAAMTQSSPSQWHSPAAEILAYQYSQFKH